MDLLTDLSLNADWGLGFSDQPNGLFGDLEDFSHLKGDMDPAFKPRDAVQQVVLSPCSQEPLDMEWMESGDLVSFLDALDKGQLGLPTPHDTLLDCSPVSHDIKEDIFSVEPGSEYVSGGMKIGLSNEGLTLTPPDSPEQVTPVITFPSELDNFVSVDTFSTPSEIITLGSQEIIPTPPPLPVVDFTTDFLVDPVESIFDLQFVQPDTESLTDSKEDISLVYTTSDDVSDLSPSSSRSSSPRPSIDSLIQSSPELYKVIATPVSSRFSPYPKLKTEQKSKLISPKSKSSKKSIPKEVELIPEEFIAGHLGKRERKKLQNKNAAIRYRQKKKAEVEGISTEVQGLEDQNVQLKEKVEDLQREIRYMKNLMEDIYKAKGLIVKQK